MPFPILEVFGVVGSIVGGWIRGYAERQKAQLESDLRVNEARTQAQIEVLKRGQEADIAWENLSIQRSGWKDEWFTIILSIPLVLCFFPGAVEYVTAGFDSLSHTPEWYRWMVGIAVGSSFGYRKIADFMSLKKGD